MANATITVALLKGYTSPVSGRAMAVADVTIVSPANGYLYPAGGFPINMSGLGLRGFDAALGVGVSQGGTYGGFIQNKVGGNPQTAYLRLTVLATGAEVAAGAAVNAETIRVAIMGG